MSGEWWTSGVIFSDRIVCQFHITAFTRGTLLNNPTSILLFQFFFIFFFTRTIHFLFHPLRQTMTVAQIVAGFIMGPSVMSQYRLLANKLFPPPGRYVLKTISSFGFMLNLFIMGVKIDMSSIRSTGAKSVVIGLSGLVFSLSLGAFAFYVVRQHTQLDQNLFTGIRVLIVLNSLTFFMVTSGYIHDLKFSKSKLGRLACSSSLVVDLLGLLGNTISLTWFGTMDTSDMAPRIMSFLSISFYYAVLFCILRPLVLYVVSKTPEGATTMKQTHLMLVLVILMLAWFWGEALGQMFATFLFGLSLPDGPPLGSSLVQKMELFTSGILLPVFCTMAGWRTNLSSWKGHPQVWVVELVFVIGHLSKLLGIIVSSIAMGVSFSDAVSLAFMMSFKGIMEVATLNAWSDRGLLDDRLFSLSMMNIVLFTGVAFPFVRHFYDPSKQYSSTGKTSILDMGESSDLRVLVCIHDEESATGVLNLVKLVNSVGHTISVFTLHLIHLKCNSMPILEPLYKYKKWGANLGHYEQAVNAFDELQGLARVQHYVSVTPYKSMHEDICSMADDKRATIIIAPFYKRWGVNGNLEACSPHIKQVNTRVILKAPCSVAILIDKKNHVSIAEPCSYCIAMLFIGGSDDHEALSLAVLMTKHHNVRLTVIWLRSKEYLPSSIQDFERDSKLMEDLHEKAKKNDRINIIEEYISNGIGTTEVVASMKHANLFVVGKYHDPNSPFIQGITPWNESPEIGDVGDMLANSDFQFSILVVQQQPKYRYATSSSSSSTRVDDFLRLSSFNHLSQTSKSHSILGV